MIRNTEEARLKLYDSMVECVCNVYGDKEADPTIVDDSMQVVKSILDGLNVKAGRSDDGQFIFTADL